MYHNQLPKTSPTKVPEATVKHIVAIRRELTTKGADNGPETIRWALAQRDLYAPSESITRRILTQQGFIFTARLAGARGGKNGFEKFLEDNSIKQKNGRPSHPQTQGKIERFHTRARHPTPRIYSPAQAGPQPLVTEDNRIRNDKVDKSGRITLRFAGQMRYLGIGRAHIGTPTLTVITGSHAITSNKETGEIIAEHHIDTERRYQPNLIENTQTNKTERP